MAKELKKWLDEFVQNGADASDVVNWPEEAGGKAVVEPVTVNPTTSQQIIEPEEGVDGFNKVTVNAVDPEQYYKPEESKTITPSTTAQTITPSSGKVINEINVEAVDNTIDNNISAENIKKNVTILGVTGEFEGESPEAGSYYYEGESGVETQQLEEDHAYYCDYQGDELETMSEISPSGGYFKFDGSDPLFYYGSNPTQDVSVTSLDGGYYHSSGSFSVIDGDPSPISMDNYSSGIYKADNDFKVEGSLTGLSSNYHSIGTVAFFSNGGEIVDIDNVLEITEPSDIHEMGDYLKYNEATGFSSIMNDYNSNPEDLLEDVWSGGNTSYKIMYPGAGDYGDNIATFDYADDANGSSTLILNARNNSATAQGLEKNKPFVIESDYYGFRSLKMLDLPISADQPTTVTIGNSTYQITLVPTE